MKLTGQVFYTSYINKSNALKLINIRLISFFFIVESKYLEFGS